MARSIITLTTDFGLSDHFVGVMKGVILSINPDVEMVDISHEVGSYDVLDGVFALAASYRYFPAGTIHLVVVDPGVGSARRPILVRTSTARFVAPDNGVLSLVYEREEAAEVRHITASHYFLKPVSNTFHGRDIFAPVAAWLSKGVEAVTLGDIISDYVRLALPKPQRVSDKSLKGTVLKIDKFGNIITNLVPADVSETFGKTSAPFKMRINQGEIRALHTDYASGEPAEIFAIVGSSGFIEVAARQDSAARILNVTRGTDVSLELG